MSPLFPTAAALAAALLASCAKDAKPEPPARKSFSERINEQGGYKQDADGKWVPRIDRRSSFEAKGRNTNFQGQYATKQYQAGDYKTSDWWANNKSFGKKTYDGNTDGSRFQKKSRLDGQSSRAQGQSYATNHYQTGNYQTGDAREAKVDALDRPTNVQTQNAQNSFVQPEIDSWRSKRAMTLQQSKGLLGR